MQQCFHKTLTRQYFIYYNMKRMSVQGDPAENKNFTISSIKLPDKFSGRVPSFCLFCKGRVIPLTIPPCVEYDEENGGMAMDDFQFIDAALELAKQAAAEGEVPVGCVIVRNGQIVGQGRNRRETAKTALGHAEIEAIADACKKLGGWRLWECTLYVTLEPCPMCAGAIVNARIPRVVFGASDQKCGACGSVCDLFSMDFNHHPQVEKGVREEESKQLLTEFFQNLRQELRTRPKWKKSEQ